MDTILITPMNLKDYSELIPQDIAENLVREPYRGIVIDADESDTSAALIWEYKYINDVTRPTVSRLQWLYARDFASGGEIFSEYGTLLEEVGVHRSLFSMTDDAKADLLHMVRRSILQAASD